MKPFLSLLSKKKNLPAAPPVDGSVPDLKPNLNSSGLLNTVAGFTKTLNPLDQTDNALSEGGKEIATQGLNMLAPGLGTITSIAGDVVGKFAKNEDGSFKSTGAAVANYALSPQELVGDLLKGDVGGKRAAKKFKEKEIRKNALENYASTVRSAQDQANVYKNKNTFMPYLAQKGGNLTSDCGCNKGADGIDTDVFKSFPDQSMRNIQEIIGTKRDGKYKESDKVAMKRKAALSGKTLRQYLETIPSFKETMTIVEKKQKGGLLFKGISKLRK